MALGAFHPAVAAWFRAAFDAPTPAQAAAWPAIAEGRDTLIAAPTGSGKTLAAFLAALDDLVRRGVAGTLADETAVIYVSPLKALSNDVQVNLERPLAGIREQLQVLGLPDVDLRASVRTGDTPQAERERMKRRPPHIMVTTPESLHILIGSASGRRMLASARTVIVDEIHALAPNKRGAHLALVLERLDALCGRRLVRIGMSATQKPIERVARFLVGVVSGEHGPAARDCRIVDAGHVRARDLALEVPDTPLDAVMSGVHWGEVHARLEALIGAHRTTLIFVNTRRMAERLARHLSDRLGKDKVTAHHGSLSREHRHAGEQRLKRGELAALVATSSLELGIDIGDVDLVCQIGSPRAIGAFLQRVGRSGHAVDGTPKGRLFAQTRDELVECAALLDAVVRGELDLLEIPNAPLDVLAQQIVAEVAACGECREDELFARLRGADSYATLERARFDAVVRMLAEGYTSRRGPRTALLHRDAVHGVLRASQGARMTAITSGGAIPDTADYDVVLEPQALMIGRVHEDFAVESLAGDVFQLGNQSYRIVRVERGKVRVEDAHGAPPSIPFWIGEAPGRTDALSLAVSRLRAEIATMLDEATPKAVAAMLVERLPLALAAARQLVDYLARAKAVLGLLPTCDALAMERFFDESGGMQLVIHSPFGSRMNRAWGLALRKRFCRSFNFELQAAATEDAIVLSLSTSHSFPLAEVARYLHSATVADVLVQALLDAPMFGVRWRWNAVTSLALPRFQKGGKVAPQLQRMKSEDLLASVFPDQVACLENIVGERQVPDHPLVAQTLHDCLHEAMDLDALIAVLQRLERGEASMTVRDLPAPSPLAAEILGARPYAFLDDAPLEERRTQAVSAQRWGAAQDVAGIGRLDAEAMAAVREEAWPLARTPDELHAALLGSGYFTEAEVEASPGWRMALDWLAAERRVARAESVAETADAPIANAVWIAAERVAQWRALHPQSRLLPAIAAPAGYDAAVSREDALLELVRARLGVLGPVAAQRFAVELVVETRDIEAALLGLEREGTAMRGAFTAPGMEEWCERHLLARIHRRSVQRLRREIEPVAPRDFMRFLFDWQHLAPSTRLQGPDALASILAQLEGFEAPAAAWEGTILPARLERYDIADLDALCQSGRIAWARLRARKAGVSRGAGPVRATPIVLLPRRQWTLWQLQTLDAADDWTPSSRAQRVLEALDAHGASFHDDLLAATRLLEVELEHALGELVAAGRVRSDAFAGLRALLMPAAKRSRFASRMQRRWSPLAEAGRWSRMPPAALPDATSTTTPDEATEHIARTLLRRYGVVGWSMLAQEAAWLPSWRDLVRVYRRLEARGEIRGGRFVAGLSGEQYALPEAVPALRRVADRAPDGTWTVVSGADPLNLVGSVVVGANVPRVAEARVVYRDGVPIARRVAGDIASFDAADEASFAEAKARLIHRDVRHAWTGDNTRARDHGRVQLRDDE